MKGLGTRIVQSDRSEDESHWASAIASLERIAATQREPMPAHRESDRDAALAEGVRAGLKEAVQPLLEALDDHAQLQAVPGNIAATLRERKKAAGSRLTQRERELEQALEDFAERVARRGTRR